MHTNLTRWSAFLALAFLIPACSALDSLWGKHLRPDFCEAHPADEECRRTYPDADNRCLSNASCMAPTALCDLQGSGMCVQCIAPDQVAACTGTTPTCGADHACHACSKHEDCPLSAACLPDGSCALTTDVAYVDPMNGGGTMCTSSMPCKKVSDALATPRPYIKLTGTIDEAVVVNGGRVVTFLAAPTTMLTRMAGNGAVVTVQDDGTSLSVYDVTIYLTVVVAGAVGLGVPCAHAAPAQPAAVGTVGTEPPVLPPVVLEAHVGQRSPEAAKALAVVLDELERQGYAARPETIERALGGQVPRPGVLDGAKTAKDIAQEIETGLEFYDRGKFREAEAALTLAREDMNRNPSLIVLDTTNEKSIFNAFVVLALAQVKLNKTAEAVETMTALQRISSTPVDRAEYGPQAEQLWRSTQKRTRAMGIGALKISVNETTAMIFLDTRYRGLGRVSLGDVVPGAHSILIQVPGTEGRQYMIGVRENETTALDVNWQVDSTLHVSTRWAGFAFATELEREQEATYAKGLARRWGRQSVIVIEPTRLGGTPVLLGVVYPAAGDPSGAWVPIDSGEHRLRDLARFLFDGTLTEGVSVLPRSAGVASITSQAAARDRRSTLPAMLVGGAGLLATAAGGIAYVASKGYDFRNPSAYVDRKTPALDVMLGGSLALGGGTYLWLRESRSAGVLPAVLLGAGTTSIASGLELYLTDEDPGPTGPRYIRNTAAQGLAVGASGMALAGAGLWLLHRDSSARGSGSLARRGGAPVRYWVPAVVADSSHAMAVCVGSF